MSTAVCRISLQQQLQEAQLSLTNRATLSCNIQRLKQYFGSNVVALLVYYDCGGKREDRSTIAVVIFLGRFDCACLSTVRAKK